MRLPNIRAAILLVIALAAPPPADAEAVAPVDAITREYTIFNDLPTVFPVSPVDAVTREHTIFNDLPTVFPVAPRDAITREFTIYLPPYSLEDVINALKITGGMVSSTPDNLSRLDIVAGISDDRVDILDVSRVYRTAMGLDP